MNDIFERKHRALESSEAVERYETLKKFGREMFAGSEVVEKGVVSENGVTLSRKFLAEGIRATNPPVWASYWEHLTISPEMAERAAKEAVGRGIDIDPLRARFLTNLHDLGRLVNPVAYLRNDFVGERLLYEMGIPKAVIFDLPSTGKLMKEAERMNLNPKEVYEKIGKKPWEEIFTPEQMEIANAYFDSMSPTQRIINLADNLGKRDEKGLFDFGKFVNYLKSQEGRYSTRETGWASSDWTMREGGLKTTKREAGAILQAFTVGKTIEWLNEKGVDFQAILDGMKDYGPRFVVVIRHGELDNPSGRVYNRDAVMKPEDIIHLSSLGKDQMTVVGKLLKERKFKVVSIFTSPETRTKESGEALKSILSVGKREESSDLDDTFAPGPYKEGITMKELANMGGDVYNDQRWGKYGHEQPENITSRMNRLSSRIVKQLKTGETGVLVSHGDPIAFFLNFLLEKKVLVPSSLRKKVYPSKGEAVVAIIDPQGEFFTLYFLNPQKGNIY